MSQVNLPREFKFVGAFSRKRRRRTNDVNAKRTTVSKNQSNEATSTLSHALAGSHGVSATEDAPPEPAQGPMPSGSPDFVVEQASQGITSMSSEPCDLQDPLRAPAARAESRLVGSETSCEKLATIDAHSLTRSYSSLMNPFLGPGFSFMTSVDQTDQSLPMCLGPGLPFLPSEDTSSPDSPQIDHLVNYSLLDESNQQQVRVTSIDQFHSSHITFQQVPCEIGFTVAQLLTRCKCRTVSLLLYIFLTISQMIRSSVYCP
jgi:hypothetical protein